MPSKHKRVSLTTFVFILILSLFISTAWSEHSRALTNDQKTARDSLEAVKQSIESVLTSRIISSKGLIAYIQINPDLTREKFENFAMGLFDSDDKIIKNLGLVKDTTILFNYPLEGNEKTIGVDLSKIEGQNITVNDVKQTGKMRLTAPVSLVQGGTGIIVRIPIKVKDPVTRKMTYWGQMSMVLDYDRLLSTSGLTDLAKENYIHLYDAASLNMADQMIFKNIDQLPEDAISETIDLYQASWNLHMIRRTGWTGVSTAFWIILVSGLLTASGGAYGLFTLMTSKKELELKVEERTASLKATNGYLEHNMAELEESQAELTEVNHQLQHSLETLKTTQDQLIISEKLAALGDLVAGVAHEINTPLGISVTLASFVATLHEELKNALNSDTLDSEGLSDFMLRSHEAIELMNVNLERASSLVNSFKQVAVDQASEERRLFFVRDAIQDVLKSLQPKLKKYNTVVKLDCPESLNIDSYPGALSQIITNLVINSLVHGFSNHQSGHITIKISSFKKSIEIFYADDGIGISSTIIDKVLNPFFSTKKQAGSTGLGLHIVHSLVTQTLKGKISLESPANQGLVILIHFEAL